MSINLYFCNPVRLKEPVIVKSHDNKRRNRIRIEDFDYPLPDERIAKFLRNYAALSDQITLTFLDPVEHPSALEEYEATADSVVVLSAETGKQRSISFDEMLVPDYMSYYYYGSVSYTEFDADGQLTSAVDYVTTKNSHVIYLTKNHGEQSLGVSVTDAIDKAT